MRRQMENLSAYNISIVRADYRSGGGGGGGGGGGAMDSDADTTDPVLLAMVVEV